MRKLRKFICEWVLLKSHAWELCGPEEDCTWKCSFCEEKV